MKVLIVLYYGFVDFLGFRDKESSFVYIKHVDNTASLYPEIFLPLVLGDFVLIHLRCEV